MNPVRNYAIISNKSHSVKGVPMQPITYPRHHHRHAFSLVEMSLVLVILGLLTGGVLMGQNLIRNSELQTIATDFSRYQQAALAFQEQYLALPGDLNNATDYWGVASGGCATPGTASGTGTQTCNGNGNGYAGMIATATLPAEPWERYRFWQHLSISGIFPGSFSGTQGPLGAEDDVAGDNVPSAKLNNSTWTITSNPDYSTMGVGTQANHFSAYKGALIFSIGGDSSAGAGSQTVAILKPDEAWNIDKKLDDGRPGTGSVFTQSDNSWPECVTGNNSNAAAARYRLDNDVIACNLFINSGL